MWAFLIAMLTIGHLQCSASVVYVTCHGSGKSDGDERDNNVLRVDTNLGTLEASLLEGESLSELRGMALVGNELFVCNAYKHDSRIVTFSDPLPSHKRKFLSNFATPSTSEGLSHPCALALHPISGDVYVSNQDTNVVLRFFAPGSGHCGPMPCPPAVTGSDPYPGTFVQFDKDQENVRGLAFAPVDGSMLLFVCLDDSDRVDAFNPDGFRVLSLEFKRPIGIFYDALYTHMLFISSYSHSKPAVLAFVPGETSPSWKYHSRHLDHPAGLTANATSLFVVSQENERLVVFDKHSTDYVGHVDLDCGGEQILLVS